VHSVLEVIRGGPVGLVFSAASTKRIADAAPQAIKSLTLNPVEEITESWWRHDGFPENGRRL
jgi:hypothetical protein